MKNHATSPKLVCNKKVQAILYDVILMKILTLNLMSNVKVRGGRDLGLDFVW
jgi:hypothetical protein